MRSQYVLDALRVCVCVKATTTPCNVEITLVIKEEIKLHEAAIFHNNKQQQNGTNTEGNDRWLHGK